MLTQVEQGRKFRALHERDRAFIIPNPWDIGTARLLAHFGFEALATTSMVTLFRSEKGTTRSISSRLSATSQRLHQPQISP